MIGESKLGGPEYPEPPTVSAAEERASREHAARVEAHQAKTGWSPESAARLAALTSRIAKLQRQPPVGPVQATLAVLAVLADLGFAVFAVTCAVGGKGDLADEAVLMLLAMFVPTVWAAWTLAGLVQRRREHVYRAERERLHLARGCGDADCRRCA
ncbi:MAG TPA: hypothetical protein VGD29_31960 [Actinoplanes sp.]|jgi:hypothetical protein